ncbi:hypothetical protein LTR17_008983 [Elasticomyces elasticus]|nr:hypothetical protein LTR17_008983 [Elasticomyces elasticus]
MQTFETTKTTQQRHPVLLAELQAGRPAGTDLGEGCYTSDYQVCQPLGEWDFDSLDDFVHFGEYLPPVHNADTPGYSYLCLFEFRYQAVAEARLGSFPRIRALCELCARHSDFVEWLGRREATITIQRTGTGGTRGIWVARIDKLPFESFVYGGLSMRFSTVRFQASEEAGRLSMTVSGLVLPGVRRECGRTGYEQQEVKTGWEDEYSTSEHGSASVNMVLVL